MKAGFFVRFLAILLLIIAAFQILPALVAWYYGENIALFWFLACIIGTALPCTFLAILLKKHSSATLVNLRMTFLLVTLAWLSISLCSALPLFFSRAIPSLADAFFETISGYTTTGASILTDIEALPRSMLFWRSLTHWLGGMGIVVLAVAILPLLGVGGMQLFKAEASGPEFTKIKPRIKDTAVKLWLVYLGLTMFSFLLLLGGGLSVFDALIHTFGSLATGGFSSYNLSAGYFNSYYVNGVLTLIMFLGGVNFILHYKMITGQFRTLRINSEFKAYLAVFFAASVLIAINLAKDASWTLSDAFSHASFQVASILTATGFSSTNYEMWPNLSQILLISLMFIGGCTGSTAGGIKVLRLLTLFKQSLIELKRLIHPNAVFTLKINGNPIRKTHVYAIASFFFLYIALTLISTMVISSAGIDFQASLTTALATLGNIGPGFGPTGPSGNYAFFPVPIKLFLSMLMIIGRLELYTVLVIFTPTFWRD